jgi:hypothetical protein
MTVLRFQFRGVAALATLCLTVANTVAYLSILPPTITLRITERSSLLLQMAVEDDNTSTSPSSASSAASRRLRDLPELKGDFDWDEKFAGDADWLTDVDQIPGKMVLNEVELAKQVAALTRLEEEWRRESFQLEDEEAKKVGFVEGAELLNGRTAMFFLAVGLLTEYWTGFTLPGQVEEMLRVGGIIGP